MWFLHPKKTASPIRQKWGWALSDDDSCIWLLLLFRQEIKVTHPSRSMSTQQESAQYLAGEDLPQEVFSALLQKTGISDSVIGLINLSPYDCHLEQCAMSSFKRTNGDIKMASLSVSKDLKVVQYCQRSVALQLMQDPLLEYNPLSCAILWVCMCVPLKEVMCYFKSHPLWLKDWKKGKHCMGTAVQNYVTQPPQMDDVDISKFPLQARSWCSEMRLLQLDLHQLAIDWLLCRLLLLYLVWKLLGWAIGTASGGAIGRGPIQEMPRLAKVQNICAAELSLNLVWWRSLRPWVERTSSWLRQQAPWLSNPFAYNTLTSCCLWNSLSLLESIWFPFELPQSESATLRFSLGTAPSESDGTESTLQYTVAPRDVWADEPATLQEVLET